jgi:hypothetical protein
MKKEILFFIITGIDYWKDEAKLGEEIRMLYKNLYNLCINQNEPVLEYIVELIENNLSNKDLGREIKEIQIPILIAYHRENPRTYRFSGDDI